MAKSQSKKNTKKTDKKEEKKEWSTENPKGRPRIYDDPEELQYMIDKYLNEGCLIDKVSNLTGEKYQEKHPTITGLVLYCGFADRSSFYNYEENELFSYTIKRARTCIEQWYESNLLDRHTGSIFALKNFGWTDKQEIKHEHTTKTDYDKLCEMAEREGLKVEDYCRKQGINLDDYR